MIEEYVCIKDFVPRGYKYIKFLKGKFYKYDSKGGFAKGDTLLLPFYLGAEELELNFISLKDYRDQKLEAILEVDEWRLKDIK